MQAIDPYAVKKVVTRNQFKLSKPEGKKKGYLIDGFNLSPHEESVPFGGRNMCPMAGHCQFHCLKKSGMNQMTTHEVARIRKTLLWLQDPDEFLRRAEKEIASLVRKAEREALIPCFRSNLLSDDTELARRVAELFPELVQYDYTKLRKPWKKVTPTYHLTYSLDVGEDREEHALECFEHGINVAVVLDIGKDSPMPKTFTLLGDTRRMIDGDKHDLRFLDPVGVFVGLRGKKITGGTAEAIDSGFYRTAA